MEEHQPLTTLILERGRTGVSSEQPGLTPIWAVAPALDGQINPALLSTTRSNQPPALHRTQLARRYHMQPLQVERQTHQTPLPRRSDQPSQRELPKPQHFLHDPNHR